jgi:hypothetical protein
VTINKAGIRAAGVLKGRVNSDRVWIVDHFCDPGTLRFEGFKGAYSGPDKFAGHYVFNAKVTADMPVGNFATLQGLHESEDDNGI